jgi:hypothetical protein
MDGRVDCNTTAGSHSWQQLAADSQHVIIIDDTDPDMVGLLTQLSDCACCPHRRSLVRRDRFGPASPENRGHARLDHAHRHRATLAAETNEAVSAFLVHLLFPLAPERRSIRFRFASGLAKPLHTGSHI